MEETRYYYKLKDGKGLLNLKSPIEDDDSYIEITKEEFEELSKIPEPTAEQKAKTATLKEIDQLKFALRNTDYQAIKFAEGWINEEEYASIKAERQSYRDRINELEALL